MKDFFARKNEANEKLQLLDTHLNNVADLATQFSGYENISKLLGFLHDFGKATNSFQEYLINGGERGSVVHALQGAFFADDNLRSANDFAGVLLKEIAALTVSAHHGGLSDGVSPDGETVFVQKLANKDDEKYCYHEAKQNIKDIIPEFNKQMRNLIDDAKAEINMVLCHIKETYTFAGSAQFALGLFVKHIYSCLIDADRLDAYLFEINEKHTPTYADWDSLINIFEENIKRFSDESKIAKIRQMISNLCKEAATKNTGIYHLSVPTGGGKTLSSLRFAMHHCKAKNKKRIIYVIPYLSIIEQTASELRKILNLQEENDIILEHHSGIVLPDGEEELEIRKLATSRWDNPIVITTMVQFLETVMSSKGSDLRKFHSMSDAVIIFDEIQSLPIKSIHLFNEAVSFLAKFRNTTVLLCTATQPLLDKTGRGNLLLERDPKLIDAGQLFDDIKRTYITYEEKKDVSGFADFAQEKAHKNGNCLAIVNTKKSAREVFYNLKDKNGFEVYHLSTSMCLTHRKEIITKIKDALDNKRKVICIATQLIEAGVDISFSCVVRATAGLDSVMQAAGRCNRNGESEVPKEVYVISLKDENLDRLDDIKCGKEITERLIWENKGADLTNQDVLTQFYEYYFYKRKNLMDYPTKDGKIVYDMLSSNNSGRGNFKNITGYDANCLISHAFQTADENFSVIDKNAKSVVVMYGEAEMLVEAYHKQPKDRVTKEKLNIMKKLEKYSVSIFSHEAEKLTGAISTLDEETGVQVLTRMNYSEDVGVVLETDPKDYMI